MPTISSRPDVKNSLPGYTDQIAQKLGIGKQIVRKWLEDLRNNGEAHIESWYMSSNHKRVPYYAAGPGVDALIELRTQVKNSLPGRADTIAVKLGITQEITRNYLVELVESGEAHIDSWKRALNNVMMPRYSPGPGVNAMCNYGVVGGAPVEFPKPVNVETIILRLLPATVHEILERVNLTKSGVQDGLAKMRKEGLAHISSQIRSAKTGFVVPVYTAGPGVNVERSGRLTRAQRTERERQAKLAKIEEEKKYEATLQRAQLVEYRKEKELLAIEKQSRREALRAIRAASKARDPYIAALFGNRAVERVTEDAFN